jgi:arylsulfatase
MTVFGLPARGQDVLPRPEQPFKGHIGRTVEESTKDFPQEVKAPQGAPNILLILTDDVGFGASSTFGGPVPTPTMDRLANSGLRYTQFHTTALCSPTRAALLTGRNHHSTATGIIMEGGTGFPGYNTLMPKSVRNVRRGAQAKRLQHGVVWQESQRARLAQQPSWTV